MSASDVSVDPEKVEAEMGWERLKSVFEIRSLLGLDGYYRRFENGLKLSIRGRIVGFRLRDMDSMVGTTLTMERERSRILEALGMRVLVSRRRTNLLLIRGRGRRLLLHTSFRTRGRIGHVRRDCPRDRDLRTLGQCSPS